MSNDFHKRLNDRLPTIVKHYGTPFHIYDEVGIRQAVERLTSAFARHSIPFKEYFAVKALPNLEIMKLLYGLGCGFDCSSPAELVLAQQAGASGRDIMFTSTNTTANELALALETEAIINLDDHQLINKLPSLPDALCFRYNPGPEAANQSHTFIGRPEESKFGIAQDYIIEAYQLAAERGRPEFGMHTMYSANVLNIQEKIDSAKLLLGLAAELQTGLGIQLSFLNLGGGLGIPYHPDESPLDIDGLAAGLANALNFFRGRHGFAPDIFMESGRYITGPNAVLIAQAINIKPSYRTYVGVDANMSALMRPGMYGAYHHITVLGKEVGEDDRVVDVVGSLCENNDKFAVERSLPKIEEGDLLLIHDTGAHGASMGFNYNGRLRPKELLLQEDGSVRLIRRAETLQDYLATQRFEEDVLKLLD